MPPTFIDGPTKIAAAGNKPKIIEEYVGRVNSDTAQASVARMISPEGWVEPGQRPEFDEFTVVLSGALLIRYEGGERRIGAGEAVISHADDWVQYSSPEPGGAMYVAVCLPAFSPETVHRDDA